MRYRILGAISASAIVAFTPLQGWSTGPRSVTSAGEPVRWGSMPIDVHVESDVSVRGKDVSTLIDEALTTWSDLDESDVTFNQEDLGSAVDENNICDFLFDASACPDGPTDDGLNPLVIDEDGSIAEVFFGTAAKFTTLGFASIVSFSTATGFAAKGEAVFNASCLDGVELAACAGEGLSFSDDDFTSFIVHELGHFLGLDHSQVNLEEAEDDNADNDDLITTMFPTFIVGNGANFKTPARDDQVGLAQLYPSATFADETWSITGTVFDVKGKTEVQCANVVARREGSARVDAISALSGDFVTAGTEEGEFVILGLTPGESYTVNLEPIPSGYTGASGYTPCRGTAGEPDPPVLDGATSAITFTGEAGETEGADCVGGSECDVAGEAEPDPDAGGGGSVGGM